MEKSKLQSFIKRTVTSLVLIPLVIGCLFAGSPYVQILALVTGAMLAWEWGQMVPSARGATFAMIYAVVMAIGVFVGPLFPFWLGLLLALIVTVYKAKGEYRRNLLILGVPYISLGIGCVVWGYDMFGPYLTLWFMLTIWAMDVGGYAFGTLIKGPKLAPKISPNKTWAGFIGGILMAVFIGTVFLWAIDVRTQIQLVRFGIIAAVFAIVAQIGDLVESAIKRSLNIKDSSDLIPGHGGVFDRLDGMIFTAAVSYLGLFAYILTRYYLLTE